MKRRPIFLVLALLLTVCTLRISAQNYSHIVSETSPFGNWNPDAPEQLKDFEPLIGTCDCKSLRRNPDGTWQDPVNMIWTYKYIMNGKAVLDESLKEDGGHSMSIRQYNVDSAKWYVTFFASSAATPNPRTWSGGKKGDNIVLYLNQKAPNGTDGYSRLTFHDISEEGYKWKGEWVDIQETITFPFWTIDCKKRKD